MREKKLRLFIKIVSFIVTVLVAISNFREGYTFIEVVLLSLVVFMVVAISLALALSEREKGWVKKYEKERDGYLNNENAPEE